DVVTVILSISRELKATSERQGERWGSYVSNHSFWRPAPSLSSPSSLSRAQQCIGGDHSPPRKEASTCSPRMRELSCWSPDTAHRLGIGQLRPHLSFVIGQLYRQTGERRRRGFDDLIACISRFAGTAFRNKI